MNAYKPFPIWYTDRALTEEEIARIEEATKEWARNPSWFVMSSPLCVRLTYLLPERIEPDIEDEP